MKLNLESTKLFHYAKKVAEFPERGTVAFIRLFFSSLGLVIGIFGALFFIVEKMLHMVARIISKIKETLAMVAYILIHCGSSDFLD